ncbi:hypothetical protein ACEN9H_08455 [Massilia cellulosiltytica]|uniref:hypothetical protein n=1 Tax=Massilia cellulosiltytica TaxID=2683234 RepID=UPI0039B61853
MALLPHRLVFDTLDEQGLVVRSALPVQLELKVQQDKPTVIYADEIVVRGIVNTAGQDLTLHCRVLRFEQDARIDASGSQGIPNFIAGLRPEPAHMPGENGLDGIDGGSGGRGGKVTIVAGQVVGKAVISACGGAGGRGQDGGHGQQGAHGSNGWSGTVHEDKMPTDANGGRGGNGGAVGLPGRQGAGGSGGEVQVKLIEGSTTLDYVIECAGGQPGPPAQPGTPGAKGLGGSLGTVTCSICEPDLPGGPGGPRGGFLRHASKWGGPLESLDFSPSRQPFLKARHGTLLAAVGAVVPFRLQCYTLWTRPGLPGGDGDEGDQRTVEVAERQNLGAAPAGHANVGVATVNDFLRETDLVFLDLLIAQFEDEYRGSGVMPSVTLRERIGFWLEILQSGVGEHTEYHARLYSMARKAALGLDVYGYSKERVPLIAFEAFQQLVKDVALSSAISIETAYLEMWRHADDHEAAQQQLQLAIRAAESRMRALQKEQERVAHDAQTLLASLPGLDAKVEAAYLILMNKYDELTNAIRADRPGCDLVTTLSAAATIVAGVSSGGAGYIAAAEASKKLYDTFTAEGTTVDILWDQRAVIEGDFKEVAKGAGSVTEAIDQIRAAVATLMPEQRKLPQFVVERQQFDEIAAHYTNLPQAKAYKEAGYHYLKCVEARNQAIVDYNALLAQWVELQAMMATSHRIIKKASSDTNAGRDLSQPYVKGVMTRLYVDALGLAGQMVHAEAKASAYLFGRTTDVRFSTMNVAAIAGAHEDVVGDWVTAKESFRPRRELEPGALVFELRNFVTDEAWTTFLEYGALSFTLRRGHPDYEATLRYLPGLRMTGLAIELTGASPLAGQKQLGWQVSQFGLEMLYPLDDRPVYFSHNPVTIQVFTPFDGSKPLLTDDFSEHDLYAGVSPYATWLVRCDAEALKQLGDIQGVQFRLSGYIVEGTRR